jgi:predicted Zn-dependent protease
MFLVRSRRSLVLLLLCAGCYVPPEGGGGPQQGTGPGKRSQALLLSPEQELALGTKVYRQVLSEAEVLPRDSGRVEKVRAVGQRIARATTIRPLQREINLHIDERYLQWEFNVLVDRQVNAFCLPGGKVAVFSGLLQVVQNDDQLATVMGHEIAHALAHHASERLAQQQMLTAARRAADEGLDRLDARERGGLVSLLSFSGGLRGLSHDRFQESEADHIGVFLMTFAGYDPRQAVVFWEHMQQLSEQRGHLPEILSDHPSDARRIAQLRAWVPRALAGKHAFDEGRIAPEAR